MWLDSHPLSLPSGPFKLLFHPHTELGQNVVLLSLIVLLLVVRDGRLFFKITCFCRYFYSSAIMVLIFGRNGNFEWIFFFRERGSRMEISNKLSWLARRDIDRNENYSSRMFEQRVLRLDKIAWLCNVTYGISRGIMHFLDILICVVNVYKHLSQLIFKYMLVSYISPRATSEPGYRYFVRSRRWRDQMYKN